ncbi:SRPBCC family protein [Labrys okinawensis]|uniref:SRPBCC family protein n=1 Tax=Labrys okinawensis TaxID=346911 RepID=UPI0039BD371F
MDMSGSQRIEASREKVWEGMNNPEVLKKCIPGCESIEMTSPTEMVAKAVLKIGPVKATFNGKVTLSDLDPPNSYTITGEGQGGVAGFAKGSATVRLEADGEDATILHYDAKADVGGKIAQLGARLIDGTAKKLAGDFFEKFGQAISPKAEGEEVPAEPEKKKGWFGKK